MPQLPGGGRSNKGYFSFQQWYIAYFIGKDATACGQNIRHSLYPKNLDPLPDPVGFDGRDILSPGHFGL